MPGAIFNDLEKKGKIEIGCSHQQKSRVHRSCITRSPITNLHIHHIPTAIANSHTHVGKLGLGIRSGYWDWLLGLGNGCGCVNWLWVWVWVWVCVWVMGVWDVGAKLTVGDML